MKKLTKSLNDIAHELALIQLSHSDTSHWTHQEIAEYFQKTHEQILEELMRAYDVRAKTYLV